MSATLYYQDGTLQIVDGDQETINEVVREFNASGKGSFWNNGDPTHRWNHNLQAWEPLPEVPFRLYWLSGQTEVIWGITIANAFNKKYGGGAINAVDWYDTKEEQTHDWVGGKWVPRKPAFNPNDE